ncbi:extracellular solute-binding protein [Candidatus Phytoplasma prunorum]|uniref:extracellular solute-binding protein n=1 Tax=Candidatus Phytoplasma prunorum TaxID=47565 RepID=UPI002FF1FBCA
MKIEVQEFQKNIQEKLSSFEPDKKDIKIIFWNSVSNSENKMLNEIINSFHKKQNHKIKVISVNKGNWPELYKNVSGVLPTDNYPNLVFCYPDFLFSYYYSGKLLPFDKFIKHSQDNYEEKDKIKEFQLYKINEDKVEINTQEKIKEETYSSYWEEGLVKINKKNKQIFSLPFFKTEDLLYYNKTYFAENKKEFEKAFKKNFNENNENWDKYWKKYEQYFNIESTDIPTISFTWKQIEILCETIKNIEKKNNKKIIPFFIQSIENLFYDSVESLKISNSKNDYFNNEIVKKEILKYFKKNFVDKEYLTSEKLFGLTDNISVFKNKEISMMINSSRKLEDYRKNINNNDFILGIAPIPYHNQINSNHNNDSKALQQGPSICLFYKKNIDEILASWYFIKYLFSEEVNKILLKSGKFSPIKQYVKQYLEEQKNYKNDLQYCLFKLMDSTNKNKFYTRVFEKSNILRESIGNLFVSCLIINSKNDEYLDSEINKNIKFYENYYNS